MVSGRVYFRRCELSGLARILLYNFLGVVEAATQWKPDDAARSFDLETPVHLLPRRCHPDEILPQDLSKVYFGSRRILEQSLYRYCQAFHHVNIYEEEAFNAFVKKCAHLHFVSNKPVLTDSGRSYRNRLDEFAFIWDTSGPG